MIAKDQNTALLIVGEAALKNADWSHYASYCFSREKGLRKDAFRHLDKFLKSAELWTLKEKIDFVKFLFPFFENIQDADYGPFPQPLSVKLVKPTLTAWCNMEQADSDPFRWFGKYYRSEEHILKALKINPKDDLARQVILSWWTYNLYFSIHHLPEGYIGEPLDDIILAEKIKDQIRQLSTIERKEYWTNELEEDLELVRNYIDWKASGHPDFERWGQKNKRRTNYQLSRVYYSDK